jgi:ethanolaminephosphotransferase
MLKYKYDGEDKSYLYRFVLTPMNIQLIRLVPMWCAPNFLTLVGLAVMMSAYALAYVHSPDFTQPLPPWLYVYSAVSLFAYQTIDNLDGRQARRTGSSSPLGLLFDHGVDALNCTFASLLLATIYQIGLLGPRMLFLFWNIGFVPFVFATWEEYYTGKLTLGEVNGPSDGMFLCMLFCLLGYFVPGIYTRTWGGQFPSLLAGTALGPWTLNTFPLLIGWVGIVATVAGNAYYVSRKVNLLRSPSPLWKLFPFVLMGVLAWSWVLSYPAFFATHARVFCFSFGFLFCQMICSLMVAHICDEEYIIARPALLPLLLAFANCVAGPALAPKLFPLVDPAIVVHLLLACNFSMWLHFVTNAILEITSLLGIRCFVIAKKPVVLPTASPSPTPTPQPPSALDTEHPEANGFGFSSSPSSSSSLTASPASNTRSRKKSTA